MPHENQGRIDYIEFWSSDLQATKAFYSELFGWAFTDFGPEYTAFDDGRMRGGFYTGEPAQGNSPLVVLYATDLETMQTRITAAGGQVVKPIFSFPGGRRFQFHDPSGNELAIWSDQ